MMVKITVNKLEILMYVLQGGFIKSGGGAGRSKIIKMEASTNT